MVDSEVPEYQLSIPETWKTYVLVPYYRTAADFGRYDWPNNYPSYHELRNYFDHCDKMLDISSRTAFETVVTGATFNTKEGRWRVSTADGRTAKAKYLVIAAGFAAKRYVPNWHGIEKFKGFVSHSSFWPDDEIDVKDKKCAIIVSKPNHYAALTSPLLIQEANEVTAGNWCHRCADHSSMGTKGWALEGLPAYP